ncbi:MAG: AMP-binding protein, partial [Alphaproteobacteria bacterium]|nr:AMP-binding protein [Alphaproteobacteria bacterium]
MKNNVGLILAKRAYLTPDLEGLVDPASGRRLSYRDLNEGCNRIANALAERGIGKGDRVAILTLNCPEFVETFFAVAKIGGVVVPLNVRLVADELAFILKDSGARTLIYGEEFRAVAAELQSRGSEATAVTDWLQVLEAGSERDDFAADYHALQAAASDAEPAPVATDDDMLYIMYTSGTTGLPKGVVHTHDTAIWASLSIGVTSELRFKDRYLLALPAYHVGALTPLTSNVHLGVTSVIMRSFDAATAWQLIERETVTVMLAVPAMLTFMYQVPERDSTDHGHLRWIMSGGAPVPVTSIEAYAAMGVEVHEVYGLTESCGPGCLISPDDAASHAGSTGKPFFHTELRVV